MDYTGNDDSARLPKIESARAFFEHKTTIDGVVGPSTKTPYDDWESDEWWIGSED